jgi:hypothetical protein
MTPMTPMSMSPTISTFGKAPQRFALVEDPLLATAASYPAPQTPLSPPDSTLNYMEKTPPEEYLDDECEAEVDIPDQEPDYSQARLLTHAKVYALAEK